MFQDSEESDKMGVNGPTTIDAGVKITSSIFSQPRHDEEWPPPGDWRRPQLAGESLPVVTACHPRENGVLAWMVYAVIGL